MNARAALPLQQAFIKMGHKQPPTPMQSDNDTATRISNEPSSKRIQKQLICRFIGYRIVYVKNNLTFIGNMVVTILLTTSAKPSCFTS